MADVHIVACSQLKRNKACAAKDMYTSDLFVKARRYIENIGAEWYILSARYGVLHPDTEIEPYNENLVTTFVAQRRIWGAKVSEKLSTLLSPDKRIVLFAGREYRFALSPEIMARTICPLAGLNIGQQKARLLEWCNATA